MSEKKEGKTSFFKKIKAKKDKILIAALLLFAVSFPLTYVAAGAASGVLQGVALAVVAIGCLLVAIL